VVEGVTFLTKNTRFPDLAESRAHGFPPPENVEISEFRENRCYRKGGPELEKPIPGNSSDLGRRFFYVRKSEIHEIGIRTVKRGGNFRLGVFWGGPKVRFSGFGVGDLSTDLGNLITDFGGSLLWTE